MACSRTRGSAQTDVKEEPVALDVTVWIDAFVSRQLPVRLLKLRLLASRVHPDASRPRGPPRAIILSNTLGFLLLPVFVLYMNRFQIEPEEEVLESLFGQDFIAYRSRVRRWL